MADGTTSQQSELKIRSLQVGAIDLHNVVATITKSQGELLLGQSFLAQFKSWSIDNEHKKLILTRR